MSTALISLSAPSREGREARDARENRGTTRPRADFIAQLIATKIAAPQTRTRRHAEPEQAVAAYAALERRPTPSGGTVSRAI